MGMENSWKKIWNNRNTELTCFNTENEFEMYAQLKKLDGFDVSIENEMEYYKSFYASILETFKMIGDNTNIKSAYEVGCGSGADLYLLHRRGISVGGIDYSEKLARTAIQVLGVNSNIGGG
jgi:2-polyprenyl-3-methyl-5-hydroxy-6-metoxy-1,4-benzoquinol methylase